MAKTKQAVEEVKQESNFLIAIGTPEGEHIVRIGTEGNIEYIKAGMEMNDVTKAFWNSFEAILPVTTDDVMNYPNDADLGEFIRARMNNKLQNK